MASRRFLAPQARTGDGRGYLSQPDRQYPPVADEPEVVARIAEARAMCDEPEAPSGAWVDAEAELAVERNRLRLLHQAMCARAARFQVSIPNRLRDAERRAKAQHLDIRQDLFVIQKQLDRGKREDAIGRLERLEARLDGVADMESAA